MSKYLVTGGCGFIGSHLAEDLINLGHQVVVLDDLSTGKLSNLPAKAEFVEGDVRDKSTISKIIPEVDGVFHLAAIASVVKSTEGWLETHYVNQSPVINICEEIHKQNKKIPVIFASSAAIYGDNENIPLKETELPDLQTPYAVDKYASELHLKVASGLFSIPSISFRFFNVFGPRQEPTSQYSGVISIFAKSVTNGSPLIIYGDGSQFRDFVFVKDVTKAMIEGMILKNSEEECSSDVINICTGKYTTINDLAELVQKISGTHVEVKYSDEIPVYIKKSVGNNSLLQNRLKILNTTEFEAGLEETLNYIKANTA
jgi:UDP-glucose 4-epimerase